MRKFLNLIMLLLVVIPFLNCKDTRSTKNQQVQDKIDHQNNTESTSEKVKNTVFYYVTATSGLSVRRQPDINAEKISTLDYGTPVEIIEETDHAFQVKEDTKTIDGKWVLIYSKEITTIKGYVFDGFLTTKNPMLYRLSNSDLKFIDSYDGESDFDLDNYLTLELISKKTYEELKKNQKNSFTIREDTLEIKKNNGTITLPTSKGLITLTDEVPDMDAKHYKYIGTIDSLNAYVVCQSEYGSGEYGSGDSYILIDKNTGKKHSFPEKPIISPDKKKIINAFMGVFEIEPTNFYLYDIEEDNYVKRLSVSFQKWLHSYEDNSVFWINKDEFCMKVMSLRLGENEGFKEYYHQYVKIKVL
ncbi:SH3 domain-containing protein [Aquimarina sp. Aq78]|uniref:SH3 domain-containing protein n=1 Tax=Aquimarina sp. Aq78 TaxID=1191889 RepID=UPI000D0E816D|nr:SH3 domain-containing protein [Aquimarina sp. Aq78]